MNDMRRRCRKNVLSEVKGAIKTTRSRNRPAEGDGGEIANSNDGSQQVDPHAHFIPPDLGPFLELFPSVLHRQAQNRVPIILEVQRLCFVGLGHVP